MFEVPEAKRIRRSELFENVHSGSALSSRNTSPPADQEITPLHAGIHFEYEYVENSNTANKTYNTHSIEHADDEEDAFEFRLFSRPTPTSRIDQVTPSLTETSQTGPSTQPTTKINIRSPTPPSSPSSGRFINPHRPQIHYLATPPSKGLLAQFAACAVTGTAVQTGSHSQWPGTSLPWRVISLPPTTTVSRRKLAIKTSSTTTKNTKQRSRPNKKRRVLMRTRAKEVLSKVEAEREKRTRRNREKKVKRKEKEKRAKMELAEEKTLQEDGGGAE